MSLMTRQAANSMTTPVSQPFFLALCWWMCTWFFLVHGAQVASTLKIGVVVNPNSLDGIEQRIAVKVAVEQLNSPALPIFLNFKNSTTLGPAAVVKDLINRWRADVVLIGAQTWTEEALMVGVKEASRAVQVPLVTFPNGVGALAPATLWPNLVRMSGRLSRQIQCIVDLVKGYNWRRVVVLYEDDGFGGISSGSISFFSKALQGIGSDVEWYKAFPRYDTLLKPTTTIEEGLKEVNESKCRVFILIQASPEFATDLFQQATNLGMMTEGYVWITNSGITRRLNSAIMSPYMQGVVELINFVNKSNNNPTYQSFFKDFRRRFKSKTGKELTTNDADPGVMSLLAYDAIQAIVKASKIGELLSSDGIAASNFHGLSGYIQFNNKELSSASNETMLGILNVVGSGVRDLGSWSQEKGFLGNKHGGGSGVEAFGLVYWPGGPSRRPGGWDVLDVLIPISGTLSEFVYVSDKGDYSGISIKVFEKALKSMPYHLRFKYQHFNGTAYTEMLKQVNSSKRLTAATGDITIAKERLQYVDFTMPYMGSGLSKLVPMEHQLNKSFSTIFLKPFTWKVWVSMATLSIIVGVVVWLLERRLKLESNRPQHPRLSRVSSGLWFAWSAIFFSQGNLHSNFARVLALMWLFVALVITQSYTASLSSILTVQKLQPKTSNKVDDKVACNNPSLICHYLEHVLDYRKEQIFHMSFRDYAGAFHDGNITSAFLETPYVKGFLSRHGENYTVTGHTYKLGGFGFAFQKGSPLASDVSNAILALTEDGTLKRLIKETFQVDIDACQSNEPVREVDNVSLDIDSFSTLFLITAVISVVVPILSFLIERFTQLSNDHAVREEHATQPDTIDREVGMQKMGSSERQEVTLLQHVPSSREN